MCWSTSGSRCTCVGAPVAQRHAENMTLYILILGLCERAAGIRSRLCVLNKQTWTPSGFFARAKGHFNKAALTTIDQKRLTYLEPILGAESGHSITAQRKRQILSLSDICKAFMAGSFADRKSPRIRRPCDRSESRNHFSLKTSLSLREDRRLPSTF